jgi:hypothetical protein
MDERSERAKPRTQRSQVAINHTQAEQGQQHASLATA